MVKLQVEGLMAEIDFFRDTATKTINGIHKILPLKSHVIHCKFAGYEIMIPIPVALEQENLVTNVEAGDVGYYTGNGILCIFYGHINPFGPVNLVGRVRKGLSEVQKIGDLVLKKGPQLISLTEK